MRGAGGRGGALGLGWEWTLVQSAAKGGNEPRVLEAALCMNVRCIANAVVSLLGILYLYEPWGHCAINET